MTPKLAPGQRFFGIPGYPGAFLYGPAEECKHLEQLFLKGGPDAIANWLKRARN